MTIEEKTQLKEVIKTWWSQATPDERVDIMAATGLDLTLAYEFLKIKIIYREE